MHTPIISLLGIPYDANSSFLFGAAEAPQQIRKVGNNGSSNNFTERGMEIIKGETYFDLGDLAFDTIDPRQAFSIIHQAVDQRLQEGKKLLCLGGDHAITYPIVAAHALHYTELHILHFDAHGDLYHNFEDNPYSHASPFARIMENGLATSLTQIGIRSLTTHQREQIKKFDVNTIEIYQHSLDFLNQLQGPLYISLDLDVLDPAFAPGVSHHEPGGFSVREVLQVLHKLQVPIVGADLVEFNPTRDLNNQTGMVAYKFMKELLEIMKTSI